MFISCHLFQVMHIIDEVLVPLTPLPNTKTEITNPDAFQFLQQSDLLDIGEENRLRFVYTYKDMFPLGDRYYIPNFCRIFPSVGNDRSHNLIF